MNRLDNDLKRAKADLNSHIHARSMQLEVVMEAQMSVEGYSELIKQTESVIEQITRRIASDSMLEITRAIGHSLGVVISSNQALKLYKAGVRVIE